MTIEFKLDAAATAIYEAAEDMDATAADEMNWEAERELIIADLESTNAAGTVVELIHGDRGYVLETVTL